MKTVRYVKSSHQPRTPDGQKLCKVCANVMPKGRRGYCSDECWERNTPAIMRQKVWQRDVGRCARCGIQCDASLAVLHWLGKIMACDDRSLELMHELREHIREITPEIPWQADHFLPVVEGGGLCGLEGYQTLCVPCHKKDTADLAKARAEERRNRKPLLLPEAAI